MKKKTPSFYLSFPRDCVHNVMDTHYSCLSSWILLKKKKIIKTTFNYYLRVGIYEKKKINKNAGKMFSDYYIDTFRVSISDYFNS